MPILDIFDTSGEPKRYARLTVVAAMCFPGSDDSVQGAWLSTAFASYKISQLEISQFFGREQISKILGQEEISEILGQEQISEMIAEAFPEMARGFDAQAAASRRMFEHFGGHRALTRNPRGVRATIDHAIENRAYRAGYAGGILIFLLAQDKACQGDASLRAVLSVFSQHARWSEKKIRDIWVEFRGVAHLWGAFQLSAANNIVQLLEGGGLVQFLADAEFLRREVGNISRRSATKPLQPETDTWTLPAGANVGTAAVAVPPFGPEQERMLEEARVSLA